MRFLVLGPVEVAGMDGEALPISGSKERTILADLIAHAGQVLSVDELIEEVWGDAPPKTAEKTLGSYVSRLRRALSPGRPLESMSDVIVTRSGGYMLMASGEEIDALHFERLAKEGRRLLDAGRPSEAGPALEEALGLWRGPAYQGYRYTSFGTSEGERLEELRRSAVEDRIDTKLAEDNAAAFVADLEAMVKDEPLRERRWAQLMLALYRAGRQAEALQAFTRARSVLVEELGIEPGPELRRLQTAILAQDPLLDRGSPRIVEEPLRSTDVCPYKGLARFEESDAEFYFGRERLVADAVGRLVGGRFLALVGPSGSGKSSLMRAGVLHALGSGAIPGSDRWAYASMRPGDRPLESLAATLAHSDRSSRLVLTVDQFEETFTACAEDAERRSFLDALTGCALVPDGSVTVVLAMRADFYGRCVEHQALASLLSSSQILVGPMTDAELRRAIELPAEQAGLTVEEKLTDALVSDSVGQAGGLPLLSTALLELWTRRRDRTLHVDDYLRLGGVEGAVARLAEDAFGRLDRDRQASAKRILLRLAGWGDGQEVVSRRALLIEFDLDRDADTREALAALTEARLVTVADGTVEVAHEALLRDWPRLRTWLEDDAEGRRVHRHVTISTLAWEEGGRDQGDMYRGARLTAALDWAEAHHPDLNTGEREFLAASRAASEGETLRARRTNRRLRALLASVAILLVLSLVVGDLALGQRDDARAAADVADARQLAARSLAEKNLATSLLLAREAVELEDSPQTRGVLLSALQRDPAAIAEMHAYGSSPGDETQWLRLSPDGSVIAAGGARATVDLFDTTTNQWLGRVDVGAATTTGDFTADGEALVVAADRRLLTIDVNSRTVIASEDTAGEKVDAILFSPLGRSLLTAESTRGKGFIVTRDPETLAPSGSSARSESGPITSMDLSDDGRLLVTTGLLPLGSPKPLAYTDLWDAQRLVHIKTLPWGGSDVALSPDGRTAALAAAQFRSGFQDSLKGRLVLLNLQTGDPTKSGFSRRHSLGDSLGLTGVTFSADGRSVISTVDDHTMKIWDASSATVRQTFPDPGSEDQFTPVLSPDGATVFTVDADGNIDVWDLDGGRSVGRWFTAGSGATFNTGFPWFAISPDGGTLAIRQETKAHASAGSIRLVDTSSFATIAVTTDGIYGAGAPEGFTFSPDGKALAVTSSEGYVQLWDTHSGTPLGPPFRAPGSDLVDFWTMPAFSPDGTTLATAGGRGDHGVVFLWNVSTGQVIRELPEQDGWVFAVNYTPDGSRLVISAGPDGGDQIVWNISEGRVERTIPADDSGVFWVNISDDGATLVTGGQSGGVRLWDLMSGEPIGPPLPIGPVNTVDLSSDGRTLAAAGRGEAIAWDVATGSILARSWFPGPGGDEWLAALFAPDGGKLFIVSASGDAWVWDMDPASWEARACQIAGRSLTEAEWQANLPDRPYDPTCTS